MKARIIIISICLAICTTTRSADEPAPSFDIELIVFRQLAPDDTEIRIPRESEPVETDAEPVEDAEPVRTVRYTPLTTAQLRLGALNDALLRSRDWSPILHVGWRQPVESRETAGAVTVSGSRRGATLSGSVRLSVERFLRLELNLEMDPGTGERYHLDQARRLRSGEVHYFDDPQFGVIALVSRDTS